MEVYLRTYFPSSQIHSLHNQEATRSAIIQSFRNLISNSKIKPQDPILIFYAGHGGEATPPAHWDTQGRKIQALVPYDYRDDGTFISDVGMGALLEELSSEKGNNIVVILDCCHSLSMARNHQVTPTSRRVRATHITEPVPGDIDQDILKGKAPSSATMALGFGTSGTTSHMLLAACEPNELAIEQESGGVFTRAFLDTIVAFGFDNLTYSDVVQYLPPLAGQSPRYEGANKDRILFDSKPGEKFESMHKEEDAIDADSVPIVPEETESVRSRGLARLEPPTRVVSVRSLGTNPTTLGAFNTAPAALPPAGLSAESKARKQDILRVCFANKPGISEIRQSLKKDWSLDGTWRRRYAFVPREKATLEIDIVEDHVVLNILNSPIDRLGLARMPYRIKLGDSSLLRNIVMAVAHFERCWRLIPEQRVLRSNIEIELTKVESRGRKKWGPVTQGEGAGNLCINHQVEVAAGKTTYGIKITNKSSIPLYPHLFLFDCSDLSITTFYRPPLRTFDASPPLQPNSTFTIGYGGEGGQPWSHYVRDDEVFEEGKVIQDKQDVDVGIFKLFLTTRPTELAFVAQQSPFFPSEYLRLTRDWKEIKGLWDAELINIVVTRNKST
ncbi:hypothetical protein CPB86DRAFT_816477 [Serendipita vermifera]|nr:hypothetical protein CPB86DRAFT_816477 [Serendipita vermifera]